MRRVACFEDPEHLGIEHSFSKRPAGAGFNIDGVVLKVYRPLLRRPRCRGLPSLGTARTDQAAAAATESRAPGFE
eukprot:6191568-Pleurochrysis_carterae.AAC.2